jgi:hypothetical protein
MMQETQEQKELRLDACHAENESDFITLKRKYQRKGGKAKLLFVPKKKNQKLTYNKVSRTERNGKKQCTYYSNQLPNEFMRDCAELKRKGMQFCDIAEAVAKNYGLHSEASVKYACKKAASTPVFQR